LAQLHKSTGRWQAGSNDFLFIYILLILDNQVLERFLWTKTTLKFQNNANPIIPVSEKATFYQKGALFFTTA